MISVIIPTLNEEKFLPNLLLSLTTQTFTDFEVIIVDGSSADKTVTVAKKFQEKLPKFAVFTSEKAGVSRQRNLGASVARGNWLLFIDADSVCMPYTLERIIAFVKTKKSTICTTWFSPDSEVVGDAMATLLMNMFFEGGLLLRRPIAPGPLVVVSREAFLAVGGFDEALEYGEDYDFTKRICEKGTNLMILRETLYVYSLRRFRYQGTLKTLQSHARAIFSVLLTNKTPRSMPGYIMGGHPYTQKRRPIRQRVIREVNKKFKGILKELFA